MPDRLENFLRNIPLLGGLMDCTWSDHWDSINQLTVIVLLSTAPIWLAALIVFAKGKIHEFPTFMLALHSAVANGTEGASYLCISSTGFGRETFPGLPQENRHASAASRKLLSCLPKALWADYRGAVLRYVWQHRRAGR